jgi:hypothetical protein
MFRAAGEDELLAESIFVVHDRAVENARSSRTGPAAGEGSDVEFEGEPPIDVLAAVQQWSGRSGAARSGMTAQDRETDGKNRRLEIPDCGLFAHGRLPFVVQSQVNSSSRQAPYDPFDPIGFEGSIFRRA